MKDFFYDNQYLSDYGFIIGYITSSNKGKSVAEGVKLTFNKMLKNSGKLHTLASVKYDTCYTTTFEICKNPHIYKGKEMVISSDEFRDIMRWLNRREYLPFYFVPDSGDDTEKYYNASFNLQKIYVGKNLIGISLTMETDSPVGYGQTQTYRYTVTDQKKEFLLSDVSDEIGCIYPDLKIVIDRPGDLTISNTTFNTTTIIKNCKVDETITMKGDTLIIQTDSDEHKQTLTKDFNGEFLKIGNTIKSRQNRITFSLPCKVELTYTPSIK